MAPIRDREHAALVRRDLIEREIRRVGAKAADRRIAHPGLKWRAFYDAWLCADLAWPNPLCEDWERRAAPPARRRGPFLAHVHRPSPRTVECLRPDRPRYPGFRQLRPIGSRDDDRG